jgi:hypothetical protein
VHIIEYIALAIFLLICAIVAILSIIWLALKALAFVAHYVAPHFAESCIKLADRLEEII